MKRKFMLGTSIWNKRGMVAWLVDGLKNYAEDAAEIVVVFDACVDGSEERFDEVVPSGLRATKLHSQGAELGEIGVDDALMRYFADHTDCDVLVVLHDDQKLAGPILSYLDRALDDVGQDAGFIGGRDGYEPGLQNMISSEWSESVLADRRLRDGEWVARPLVNPAPLIWTRRAINDVGFLNMEFDAFYWWNDYAHRCSLAGLTNAVMGTPIIHKRFGAFLDTKYASDGSQARDSVRIEDIWGPIGLAG